MSKGRQGVPKCRRGALIIEEGQTIRASLFSYLQDMALDIYSAASLQDARALFPVLKPALTIVDRELRDGDGLDLIEPARQAGAHVFVVSTSNEVVDRVRALTLGADDYMGKPADPEEIYPPSPGANYSRPCRMHRSIAVWCTNSAACESI